MSDDHVTKNELADLFHRLGRALEDSSVEGAAECMAIANGLIADDSAPRAESPPG